MLTTNLLIAGCGSLNNNNPIINTYPNVITTEKTNNVADNNTKVEVQTNSVEKKDNKIVQTENVITTPDKTSGDVLQLTNTPKSTTQSNVTQVFNSKAKQIDIVFYPTYGNDKEVNVKGRVLKEGEVSNPSASDSKLTNLIRNLDILKNDEVKNISIEVTFNGKTVKALTDDEGVFNVKIKDFGQVQTGYSQVLGSVSKDQTKYVSGQAHGKITIQNQADTTFGIVSDIDDTIKKSYVTDKLKAAKTLLFNNYTTQERVVGTPELYQALDKSNDKNIDGDVYYISGSPMQLSGSLESFIDYNHFPEGSIDLKRMGLGKTDDSPTEQIEYKLSKLRPLFEEYPNKKFILFGDSGEKDPEIYKQIAKEYPNRVIATYINNVTNDDPKASRYENMLLTKNASESALDLHKKGLITSDDYNTVKNAVK